jgi:hypothetical protein
MKIQRGNMKQPEATVVHNLASPEIGALATRWYYFEIMSKSDSP